jgi:hypothetical protein
MSGARVELRWSPDDQRKRVRRNAAITVLLLLGLLWALSRAEAPDNRLTGMTTTAPEAPTETTTTTTTTTQSPQTPAVPLLALSAPNIDFGELPVGGATERPIAFRNDGTIPFEANAIAFAGGRVAAFEVNLGDCGRVAPGTGCTATAIFRPAEARDEKAQVALLDRTGAQSDAVTLSGRGTARVVPPAPLPLWHHVAFDAPMIEVPQGTTAPVVVRNSGEDDALLGKVALDADASFTLDPGQCQPNRKLAPSETCTAVVSAGKDRGVRLGNLRLFDPSGRQEDVATVINVTIPRQTPPVPPGRLRFPVQRITPRVSPSTTTLH